MKNNQTNIPLIFFFLTITVCSIAELILLEIKYEFFSGGFGQAYQLLNPKEIIVFLISFFGLNLFLYGSSYLIWKTLLSKLKIEQHLIAFHFMMLSGILTAMTLVIQLELHKYFADAMDTALIKNLGGGDIKTSLIYIMDEMSLFFLGVILMIFLYFVLYKIFKYILNRYNFNTISYNKHNFYQKKYLTLSLPVIIFLIIFINNNEYLRNNLRYTNSYYIISSVLDTISDFDRDGYGSFKYPQDRNIFDSTIFPGALDIPDNNIDEDGFLGDFVNFQKSTENWNNFPISKSPKHIIIIFMESTRSEVVGKKINGVTVAPNLSQLAQEGQSVKEAYSHTGYTATSMSSFFSGSIGSFNENKSLYPILKKLNYHISVFSTQDESWGQMDIKLGTKKYADFFYDSRIGVNERVSSSRRVVGLQLSEEHLWDKFKEVSDTLNWAKPQFIYFNMQAAHFPYFHRKMTRHFVEKGIPRSEIKVENRDWLVKTYWNALNYADIYIGKFIKELKNKGVWDNTLFIITGDHGEELFDSSYLGHGFLMSKIQTQVPLVINQRDFKITSPAGHSDIKSLILSYAVYDGQGLSMYKQEDKFVFQFIGTLDKPAKISLRYANNKTISLNLKNMQVRPKGQKQWISYSNAIKDAGIKPDLEKLIHHWENLRWQSHLEKQKVKEKSLSGMSMR